MLATLEGSEYASCWAHRNSSHAVQARDGNKATDPGLQKFIQLLETTNNR